MEGEGALGRDDAGDPEPEESCADAQSVTRRTENKMPRKDRPGVIEKSAPFHAIKGKNRLIVSVGHELFLQWWRRMIGKASQRGCRRHSDALDGETVRI